MDKNFEASFTRYLSAKRSVDDRALARSVWGTVQQKVNQRDQIKVLELGSGIGTMVERMLDWGFFEPGKQITYTLVDEMAENSEAASERLISWASQNGYQVTHAKNQISLINSSGSSPIELDIDIEIEIEIVTAEAFEFMQQPERAAAFDLIIANAFLDLVNLDAALRRMDPLLKNGGIYYFSINYDGVTTFEPKTEHSIDSLIENLYHQDMDKKRFNGLSVGGKHSGRILLAELIQKGYKILDVGGSDWIVYPQDQSYPQDEAYFLHFIIDTIRGALDGHPQLDADAFRNWISTRHAQIEAGELIYVTHQLDFCVSR